MKYKALYDDYDFIVEDKLLHILLKNRGVESPDKLLKLDKTVLHDGQRFKNINEGLELLHNHIEKSKQEKINIHIIVDSDCDGYCSSGLAYQYISDLIKKENLNINVTFSLHEGKQHGIRLKELKGYDFDLLIVPDAGSSDLIECKELKSQGKDILILDHHEMENDNTYATVINCMDKQYPNTTLSGTGVTYKFFKEFDKKYEYDFANKYLNLVALGNIGDSMDLRNYETRYLTLLGLNDFGENNLFLQEIMNKQEYSLKDGITITSVGWYIAPLFNAVVRSGDMEEKTNVFKALIGVEETKGYKKRKTKKNPNPEIENQTLQEYMARECVNIKGRQDRQVKKGVGEIKKKIKDKELDKNKILMVDGTGILDNNFTGLVANKLASAYKRPAILLKKHKNGLYGGSGRNYRLSSIIDLRKFLLNLDTFKSVEGHDNAFGFLIDANKLVETRDKVNEQLKNVLIEDIYKVDYEIPVGRLKERHIKQVGQWYQIWGNTLNEPLFAITDIYIPTEDIKLLGQRKNIIRFDKKIGSNKITFIKFFANEGIYNKMVLKSNVGLNKTSVKRVRLDIIGKFKINKWQNNEYPQIEIIDFNSVKSDDFVF